MNRTLHTADVSCAVVNNCNHGQNVCETESVWICRAGTPEDVSGG
jgi:hypothetical protein